MPTPTPSPKLHLAIIPDGNRRWAKERGLMPWKGHQQSAANFHKLIEWCLENKRVGVLTFWCFSTENWKRDKFEIGKLMELLEKYLRKERENLKRKRVRLAHSGRKDRITQSIAKLIDDIGRETSDDPALTLHIALDYGGKDEVVRAVDKLRQSNEPVTEDTLRAHMDHPELPDIDLIIRTSGERRTSNFFLWQSAYAEWTFLDKHFPDVGPEDLDAAIEDFTQRKRRFGK